MSITTFLKLALFFDESHLLIGADSDAVVSEESANPKIWATALVCRALREYRKHLVCLLLGDQHPSTLAPEVLSMVGTKLLMRTVDRPGREVVMETMVGGAYEYEQCARLLPGEGFLYTEGFHRPRLIKTVNLTEQMELDRLMGHEELKAIIRDEPWRAEARAICENARLERLAASLETFDARRLALTREAAMLSAAWARARHAAPGDEHPFPTAAEARRIRESLEAAFRDFRYGPYREWIGADEPGDSAALREARAELVRRVEEEAAADTRRWTDRLDELERWIDEENRRAET